MLVDNEVEQLPRYKGFIPAAIGNRFAMPIARNLIANPTLGTKWYAALITNAGMYDLGKPTIIDKEGQLLLVWKFDSRAVAESVKGSMVEYALFNDKDQCHVIGALEVPKYVSKHKPLQISFNVSRTVN